MRAWLVVFVTRGTALPSHRLLCNRRDFLAEECVRRVQKSDLSVGLL